VQHLAAAEHQHAHRTVLTSLWMWQNRET
jgi:hypothetical protein